MQTALRASISVSKLPSISISRVILGTDWGWLTARRIYLKDKGIEINRYPRFDMAKGWVVESCCLVEQVCHTDISRQEAQSLQSILNGQSKYLCGKYNLTTHNSQAHQGCLLCARDQDDDELLHEWIYVIWCQRAVLPTSLSLYYATARPSTQVRTNLYPCLFLIKHIALSKSKANEKTANQEKMVGWDARLTLVGGKGYHGNASNKVSLRGDNKWTNADFCSASSSSLMIFVIRRCGRKTFSFSLQ
jgi:hypothetical protein